MQDTSIAMFKGQGIRKSWSKNDSKWFFSVVDVVAVLTDSVDAGAYWRKLKERLLQEGGNETVTNCHSFPRMGTVL